MSSAFMMLLLDELPEGWILELSDPGEWADGDDFDDEADDHSAPTSDAPTTASGKEDPVTVTTGIICRRPQPGPAWGFDMDPMCSLRRERLVSLCADRWWRPPVRWLRAGRFGSARARRRGGE